MLIELEREGDDWWTAPSWVLVGKVAPIPDAFTQRVFQSVCVSRRTYTPACTGLRARKFVGDKRCWYVVNHSGPVEGGKGRRIVAPPWFLFDANPLNHDLVYQRFLCCSPLSFFLPSLFFIHFLLVFYLMIVFQICRNVFNSMTAQGLWSIVVFPISRVRFYGIAMPITIARGKLLYKIWDCPCFLRFVSVLEIL